MKQGIKGMLLSAIAAIAVVAPAKAELKSKAIVIETPADLPEFAQAPTQAMYIHHTAEAQAILYLEQNRGRRLAILDVSDPGNIRAVGQVSINAPAAFDFVQSLSGERTLIRYRDKSGFAVISFKNYREPVLTAEPEYLHPASGEADGDNGVFLVSNGSSTGSGKTSPQAEYQVLTVSTRSAPQPLATIKDVMQRVDRPQTGTIFLLTTQGVTVVRCLASEREHQTDVQQKDEN